MAIFAPFIPEIYNTTENVKTIASQLLVVTAVMMPLHGFTHTCYFTLRSGGKTLVTFVFDCGFMWALCIPLAFVLSRFTNVGILEMFIAVEALNVAKALLGFVLIKNRTWVKNLVAD